LIVLVDEVAVMTLERVRIMFLDGFPTVNGSLRSHKNRMLFLVLEACAVTRSCLDGQAYEELCRHPELRTLEETARHALSELAAAVGVGRGTAIAEDEPGREAVPTVEEPALAPTLRGNLAPVTGRGRTSAG
jgi:hypothetical protein